MTKTISEWLMDLPEPAKTKAITNFEKASDDWKKRRPEKTPTLKDAIIMAFPWRATPEGFNPWYKVFNSLKY